MIKGFIFGPPIEPLQPGPEIYVIREGPFVAEKICFFSAQRESEMGPFGTLHVFALCHQTSYEQLPYPFPEFGSFLIHNRAFLNTS